MRVSSWSAASSRCLGTSMYVCCITQSFRKLQELPNKSHSFLLNETDVTASHCVKTTQCMKGRLYPSAFQSGLSSPSRGTASRQQNRVCSREVSHFIKLLHNTWLQTVKGTVSVSTPDINGGQDSQWCAVWQDDIESVKGFIKKAESEQIFLFKAAGICSSNREFVDVNHFLLCPSFFLYFTHELQISRLRPQKQSLNCKKDIPLPLAFYYFMNSQRKDTRSMRVVAARKSSLVLVAVKSMRSKIWTGAQNSKEGKVSWTAWQQFQAWTSVLFRLGIVRLLLLVLKFRQQEDAPLGGHQRRVKRWSAPQGSMVSSHVSGKYDSALVKCSISSAFGPCVVGPYCLVRVAHVSWRCNLKWILAAYLHFSLCPPPKPSVL